MVRIATWVNDESSSWLIFNSLRRDFINEANCLAVASTGIIFPYLRKDIYFINTGLNIRESQKPVMGFESSCMG
jgi:preprotein translocase subunit SecB